MLKGRVGKPTLLKNLNKQVVLNIIRSRKTISKIEISRISDLKPPTIANIVNEFLEEDLIVYAGKGSSNKKGGPRPVLYEINPGGRYFIGMDINVKGVIGVILDLDGKIVHQKTVESKY